MAAGYCFGPILTLDVPDRRRWTLRLGGALTLAFLLIRTLNVYGDPSPWNRTSILSFLRVTKYPPSLDFILMTLGPALILLSVFDRLTFSRANPLTVYGKVPLFYFLAHFYLLHALLFVLTYFRYGRVDFLLRPLPMGADPKTYPSDFGYPLWAVYVIWAAVVMALYPACLWFARLKQSRTGWWLSYL